MFSLFKRKVPHFKLPQGVRLYAVGDIHGKADLLKDLLARIEQDAQDFSGNRIIEVFLGDYIDRGDQSREVIERLLEPPESGHERVCLRGNHEQALLDALGDVQALRRWMQHGGLATLDSYGVHIPSHVEQDAAQQLQNELREALPEAHLRFLQHLKEDFSSGDYYCVHAGVHPARALNAQKTCDKLMIRNAFLSHNKPFEKYILHGHTPLEAPDLLAHRANLDVSNAARPTLCALRVEGEQRHAILAHAED